MTDEPSPSQPLATENLGNAAPESGDDSGAGAPLASDSLVQTALRLLPVPEHAPGFWEDLDVALAAEPRRQEPEPSMAVGPGRTAPPGATSGAGGPLRPQRFVAAPTAPAPANAGRAAEADPSRRLVPPSLRRRSNVVVLVLLVAAVALVLGCAVLLVRDRSDAGLGGNPSDPGAAGAIAPPAG